MKKQADHLESIAQIRLMMEQSSRFISLSGISGILIGIIAIAGAMTVYWHFDIWQFESPAMYPHVQLSSSDELLLVIIALIVLGLSILSAYFFTNRKACKDNKPVWTPAARRLTISLAIPLSAGGIVLLFLLYQNLYYLLIPFALIFYGMSLLNAGKYSLDEVRQLGVMQITTGLVALWFSAYGLIFWVIGFGLLHILYGIIMYNKYER